MTLGTAVLAYVAERAQRGELTGQSPGTYRKVLWRFAEDLGPKRDVRRLNARVLERWATERRGLAPSTRRLELQIVRNFCQSIVRKGYLRRDPTIGLRGPREPRRLPRGRNHDDVARIFAACPDRRAELMVSLMTQEGLRCCEVSSLDLGDIDLDDRTMLVRGKGGHQRVLPISEESWHLLTSYVGPRPPAAGPLIRSYVDPSRGLKSHTISQQVGAIIHDAGVAASAHALRHTAASDMLRSGAHVRDVQAALGHASLATTQRYLPWVVGDLREAMGGRTYRTNP